MKLCVFQGTFNPVHNAHLRVADYVCQNFNFDKIFFIPAFCPPHKQSDPNMSIHRLNMVNLAVLNNPCFEVSDIEYKRGGKSYTYDTITELYREYDVSGKINFIIGTDAFEKIKSWYRADELKNIVKFIVFVREDNFNILKYDYLKECGYDFEFQTLSYEDISSSELRNRIRKGADISEFVPQKVEEYIVQNGLYKD